MHQYDSFDRAMGKAYCDMLTKKEDAATRKKNCKARGDRAKNKQARRSRAINRRKR